ncbi:MAG: 23S rRNA (adenine(2030)-N(6))-methyltransferase RlmJ [Betaproteobacteria bacterium]|nr:23S rRNA (adenine(2030)-N(6))-methyltransferase RlmJ [Betaproteobacteria bacterium]
MLSYRHAFHAGNHADVLKHFILCQLIEHLKKKEKPFTVIDTHAGAGLYALDAGHATKLSEYEGGIARVMANIADAPAAVAEAFAPYLECVRELNPARPSDAPDAPPRAYPGSPWIAYRLLRGEDRLRLFELHSTDVGLLGENFREAHPQVIVTRGDGFAGLKASLPPPSRRGLALIDPSYELRDDYPKVLAAIEDALRRFADGVYAVWIPRLPRRDAQQLPDRLKRIAGKWLHVALNVRAPGEGMIGSDMFILNPPWTLAATLREALPWLCKTLAQDAGASFTLEENS